uniref:Uncharacterized protein n=1 Tax=Globisporangium ultimum (strain ATCC 200006 / CBS 805.95 / DAOM BR144) TaxID=431595 RepID=K3WCC2_GLOUD
MGNFASTITFSPLHRSSLLRPSKTTVEPYPCDFVTIDFSWLEADTQVSFDELGQELEIATTTLKTYGLPASSSLTSYLAKAIPAYVSTPWVLTSAIRRCQETMRGLVVRSTSSVFAAAAPAPVALDSAQCELDDEHFFDEFHQVFEPRFMAKKMQVPSFIVPPETNVEIVGAPTKTMFSKMKSLYDAEDDDDEFSDCMSYTTDTTELLSECESDKCCYDFGDSETEDERPEAADDSSCFSYHDNDCDEDEDCETMAERLLRMASSCSDINLYVDDYLCQCGECPHYKLIAYEVKRYGTYANDAELRSLTRILQAFSTYNEAVGYDCNMILTAEECLQLWDGDEDLAFTSFVMLCDEVPHLCGA